MENTNWKRDCTAAKRRLLVEDNRHSNQIEFPLHLSARYNPLRGGSTMITLLQQAFTEAAKLPEPAQEVLASRLLAELAAEDAFDLAIARSSDKLATLAREALDEHRAGQSEVLDPERL